MTLDADIMPKLLEWIFQLKRRWQNIIIILIEIESLIPFLSYPSLRDWHLFCNCWRKTSCTIELSNVVSFNELIISGTLVTTDSACRIVSIADCSLSFPTCRASLQCNHTNPQFLVRSYQFYFRVVLFFKFITHHLQNLSDLSYFLCCCIGIAGDLISVRVCG